MDPRFLAHERDAGIREVVLDEVERCEGDVVVVGEDDEDFEGGTGGEDLVEDAEVCESGVALESEGEVGEGAEVGESGPARPDCAVGEDLEVGECGEGGVGEVGYGGRGGGGGGFEGDGESVEGEGWVEEREEGRGRDGGEEVGDAGAGGEDAGCVVWVDVAGEDEGLYAGGEEDGGSGAQGADELVDLA